MELSTEKSATQKLESGKLVLERQNKELKAKLAELETATRTKTKVMLLFYSWIVLFYPSHWSILLNLSTSFLIVQRSKVSV